MSATIFCGYRPGAIGRITELHARYYASHWELGLYFEAKVATELAEFVRRLDPAHDGLWLAEADGEMVGSMVIDGAHATDVGARLRWFIVDPAHHRQGLGGKLMRAAMTFCDEKRFRRVYLTTFAGLDAARRLYEANGFTLCGEHDGAQLTGSSSLTELVFERLCALG